MAEEQGEDLLSVIPNQQIVYHDQWGTSRIFDPNRYTLIGRHYERMKMDFVLLYRERTAKSWFLLRVNKLVKVVSFVMSTPRHPTGDFLSEHEAVNWLLDHGQTIPDDIDISDRTEIPAVFVQPAMPVEDLMTIDEIYLVTLIKQKTLRNRKVLGNPAEKGGGRGQKSRWHYLLVKPEIEAEFGKELPSLDRARAILSSKIEVSSEDS